MLWIITGTLLMGVTGLCIFLLFLQKGQFNDVENIKYQMFWEDKDDAKKT